MGGKVFIDDVYSAKEIKRRMITYDISQKTIAGCLGVTEQFVSRVLCGKVPGKYLRLRITLFLQSLEK